MLSVTGICFNHRKSKIRAIELRIVRKVFVMTSVVKTNAPMAMLMRVSFKKKIDKQCKV